MTGRDMTGGNLPGPARPVRNLPGQDLPVRDVAGPPGRPRLLVLRALGLGDLLTAVPALRALRRRCPGHEIVLAAPGRLAGAAEATGAVDRLLPVSAPGRAVPSVLPWTGPPPDMAVDLHGNGPPSHLLLKDLRPGRLLAYAHPGTPDIPGPVWDEDEHERARWCRLLGWYGIPADPADLSIEAPATPSPAPGAVVLHPGADAEARRWPAERFAAVARGLRERGYRVVVTAGSGEGPRARRVAELSGLPPGSVLGGDLDVPYPVLASLVARARAVVAGDTGLAHLATALGTPSVILFGPVAPRLWGPPHSPRHRALWTGDPSGPARPGDAHGDRPDERLLRLTPDAALRALDAILTPPGTTAPARDTAATSTGAAL